MICNAKAKGLNKHPKYPVLFSLVGKMGMGKGWLATMIKSTYDAQFETTSRKSSFKKLFGTNFNSIMMTRGFIHFDEKNGIDSSQCEELKTLITEPEVDVEMKYKESMTVKNLVTFFSTTNESIKDVMGLQQDRRLVEFVLKDKTAEIPVPTMTALLNELWEVMPCEYPHPETIVDELLEESKEILDTKMVEIVASLFRKEKAFLKNKYVNRHDFIETVKEFGGVRHAAVFNWCVDNGIFVKQKNGSYYLSSKNLNKVLDEQRAVESIGSRDSKVEDIVALADSEYDLEMI